MERIRTSIPPTLEGWVYIIPIHGPLERIMASIPPTLEEWVYIIPIHGPLYIGSIYSNTPPQSELSAQRCSRLDNKKANTRHTQLNTPREEEGTGGGVIELTPVVHWTALMVRPN